jgi:hypothetical protein
MGVSAEVVSDKADISPPPFGSSRKQQTVPATTAPVIHSKDTVVEVVPRREYVDPLVSSNVPLLLVAYGFVHVEYYLHGMLVALSAIASILYHSSGENTFWLMFDQPLAAVAFVSSLFLLQDAALRMEPTWKQLVFTLALATDIFVAFLCYTKAIREEKAQIMANASVRYGASVTYKKWHTAWHLAIVVGQGILLAALLLE